MKMAHGGYIKFSEQKGRTFYLRIKLGEGNIYKYQLVEYKLDEMLSREALVDGKLWRKVEFVALPKVLRNGRLFDNSKRAGEYLYKYVYHLDR